MTEYEDVDGCHWDHYEDYVFYQFGYSNYSGETRNAVMKTLHELWLAKSTKDGHYFIRKSEGFEWCFQELLLGILDHSGLTEYGTSPRGSWLTKKGLDLLNPLFTDGPCKYVESWDNAI